MIAKQSSFQKGLSCVGQEEEEERQDDGGERGRDGWGKSGSLRWLREEVKEAWGWGSRSRRRRGFFKLVVAQVVQAVVVVWRAGGGVSRGGTRRTGGEGGGTVLGDSSVVATQARRAHQEKASTVGSRESSLSHINLVIRTRLPEQPA